MARSEKLAESRLLQTTEKALVVDIALLAPPNQKQMKKLLDKTSLMLRNYEARSVIIAHLPSLQNTHRYKLSQHRLHNLNIMYILIKKPNY